MIGRTAAGAINAPDEKINAPKENSAAMRQ
jgi:hypothetical protein